MSEEPPSELPPPPASTPDSESATSSAPEVSAPAESISRPVESGQEGGGPVIHEVSVTGEAPSGTAPFEPSSLLAENLPPPADPGTSVGLADPAPESLAVVFFRIFFRVAEPCSVAATFIFILFTSWMRWPDPLIDFPRDLYITWRVSLGERLYDQVASWYGPLAHLVEAAGFRIFGVGIDTIVWMNVALTVIIILLLRGIFGALGNRFTTWVCTMTFLMVYLCGHFVDIGNYNYITPYVAQTTYGLAGLLLMIWALLRYLKTRWPFWLGVAGWGIGVTYLDKPEPLFAAVGAVGVFAALQLLRIYRLPGEAGGRRGAVAWGWPALAWLAGGFLAIWLPVFLIFLMQGGIGYALRATDWVFYTMLDSDFRNTIAKSHIMTAFFGFDALLKNFLIHLQDGMLLILVGGILAWVSRGWARARRFSLHWWLAPVVVAVVAGWVAWLGSDVQLWLEFGKALIFPSSLILIASLIWCGRTAWLGTIDFPRAAGLAVVAAAAVVMLGRMILNGRIYHYGFFMTPLAVLLIIHVLAAEAARPGAGQQRANWLLPIVIGGLALGGGISLLHISLHRYAMKTLAVGQGRDRFYTFQADLPPNFKQTSRWDTFGSRGLMLNVMLEQFKTYTPHAKSVVAIPETAAINYHLRLPTPTAEVEFHPTALGFVTPAHVLKELQTHPPEAIFFYERDLREYGVPFFGADEGSGRNIALWVQKNYEPISIAGAGKSALTIDGNIIDLLVPRTKNSMPTPEELLKASSAQ